MVTSSAAIGSVPVEWILEVATRSWLRTPDGLRDERVERALTAAALTSPEEVEDLEEDAWSAVMSAREYAGAGYHAMASAALAVAEACAPGSGLGQARRVSSLALDSLRLASAPCEAGHQLVAERRRQWQGLPEHLRRPVLGDEPGPVPTQACGL